MALAGSWGKGEGLIASLREQVSQARVCLVKKGAIAAPAQVPQEANPPMMLVHVAVAERQQKK